MGKKTLQILVLSSTIRVQTAARWYKVPRGEALVLVQRMKITIRIMNHP